MKPDTLLLVSCEHGGNAVPPAYAHLFDGHGDLLPTHRGWDPGALTLAERIAATLHAPLFAATTTRLLIDLNRSIGHKTLHSEATRGLPLAVRREIAAAHYRPHRDAVETAIATRIKGGARVLHVASHSFTPELNGQQRQADVAFLYDSRRPAERDWALRWQRALAQRRPDLRLRRNYPYDGKDDGLTALMRRRYAPDQYLGIELEINQRFVLEGGPPWPQLQADVITALATTLPPMKGLLI